MLTMRLVSAAAIAGIAGTAWLPAPWQDPAPARPADFVLEKGAHNIRDLIDRAAIYLGRNYVFSEADMANVPDAQVQLQNRLVLDAVGCEEVVAQLAYTKGLSMLPLDPTRGLYEWINRMGPKRAELLSHAVELTPAEVMAKRRQCIPVRVVLPVEGIDINTLCNQLRPYYVQSGAAETIVIGQGGSMLLLAGSANCVANAIELIEKITGPLENLDPGLLTWKTRVDQRLDTLEKKGKATTGDVR